MHLPYKQWFLIAIALMCTALPALAQISPGMKDLQPRDYFEGPQLALARAIKSQDLAAVQRLAPQTDLNTPAKQGMTILFFAFNEALVTNQPQSLAIMTQLVKAGADAVNHEVPSLGSVWGVAMIRPEPQFAQALMDGGVSPDAHSRGKDSRPGIFDAANEQSFAVLKLLVARGANINIKDSVGGTPLYSTLLSMQLSQMQYLLEQGADPNTVNNQGVSLAWMLKRQMEHKLLNARTRLRLEQIKGLAISKGMRWPPVEPAVERERMSASSRPASAPAAQAQ